MGNLFINVTYEHNLNSVWQETDLVHSMTVITFFVTICEVNKIFYFKTLKPSRGTKMPVACGW